MPSPVCSVKATLCLAKPERLSQHPEASRHRPAAIHKTRRARHPAASRPQPADKLCKTPGYGRRTVESASAGPVKAPKDQLQMDTSPHNGSLDYGQPEGESWSSGDIGSTDCPESRPATTQAKLQKVASTAPLGSPRTTCEMSFTPLLPSFHLSETYWDENFGLH